MDRGYNSIDLVIISHFDLDHVNGILTLLNTLDVKKVIISKQYEMTDNYKEFLKIISNKNTSRNSKSRRQNKCRAEYIFWHFMAIRRFYNR